MYELSSLLILEKYFIHIFFMLQKIIYTALLWMSDHMASHINKLPLSTFCDITDKYQHSPSSFAACINKVLSLVCYLHLGKPNCSHSFDRLCMEHDCVFFFLVNNICSAPLKFLLIWKELIPGCELSLSKQLKFIIASDNVQIL